MSPGLGITNAKSSSKKEEAYMCKHKVQEREHENESRNISGNDRDGC
jgi:hypothetical protein